VDVSIADHDGVSGDTRDGVETDGIPPVRWVMPLVFSLLPSSIVLGSRVAQSWH